jgi:hypothetical protein
MKKEEERAAVALGSPQSSGSTDTEDSVPKYWRIEMQKHIHVGQEMCFCENTTAKREKQGYVQCARCASWSHAQCAGFQSLVVRWWLLATLIACIAEPASLIICCCF